MSNPVTLNREVLKKALGKVSRYELQIRDFKVVDQVETNGCVDVVYIRSSTPCVLVATPLFQRASSVKTRFAKNKLVIKQESVTATAGGTDITVTGSGNIVAGRDVIVAGKKIVSGGNVASIGNGNIVINPDPQPAPSQKDGRCIVVIAMPVCPDMRINGSSDLDLLDVEQETLNIAMCGTNDMTAAGSIGQLTVSHNGVGDLDSRKLVAKSVSLMLSGISDARVSASDTFEAAITGSAEIVVRGEPKSRDVVITGKGSVKYK